MVLRIRDLEYLYYISIWLHGIKQQKVGSADVTVYAVNYSYVITMACWRNRRIQNDETCVS